MSKRVFSRGSAAVVSFEDVRREVIEGLSIEDQQKIAAELVFDASVVPSHLKVSCPFGGCTGGCRSPSKRDFSKPKRAWVCGSNFSHNDRLAGCVAYVRLDKGLRDGQSGNGRFPK